MNQGLDLVVVRCIDQIGIDIQSDSSDRRSLIKPERFHHDNSLMKSSYKPNTYELLVIYILYTAQRQITGKNCISNCLHSVIFISFSSFSSFRSHVVIVVVNSINLLSEQHSFFILCTCKMHFSINQNKFKFHFISLNSVHNAQTLQQQQ